MIMHTSRTVIHPDYCGMNLGILLKNQTAKIVHAKGYTIMSKLSNAAMAAAQNKSSEWALTKKECALRQKKTGNIQRKTGYREKVVTYSFRYKPSNE